MTKILLAACAFMVVLATSVPPQASGQHQHTPPGAVPSRLAAAEAGHHACLEQERASIEHGEGLAMALVADRNGYPGPRYVLELKADLKLTPEQESAMEKLFAQVKQQAVARGKEVLVAEEKLGAMLAQKRPEAELREQAYRVATLRAELRWTHLSAHLAARKLLTPEQLAAYQQIRHGSGTAQQTSR